MKARPILFSGDMIRALIAGRKTQTRRIVKPLAGAGWRPETANGDTLRLGMITSPHPKKDKFGLFMRREIHPGSGKYEHDLVPCPYGKPGDRLWVREMWAARPLHDDLPPRGIPKGSEVYYPATPELGLLSCKKRRPSIHMPRWASRITLEITGVRVERLQDISDSDARAEGIERMVLGGENKWKNYTAGGFNQWEQGSFRTLWESINGPGSWDENPWVWAIEFDVHQCNVDELIRQREGQPS